jgi:hypothetical protein
MDTDRLFLHFQKIALSIDELIKSHMSEEYEKDPI